MAQKLNLDFSIGESIVKGINSTPEVRIGSVNINLTDATLVGTTRTLLSASNETITFVTTSVKSINNNYKSALESFKDIQDKSLNGAVTNTANAFKEGIRNSLAGVKK